MANRRITTSELDFDAIKTSLKTYLQGQSQFSDYDFAGSGMDVLLDILAYNTHYNALYHNMAINEAFLDSASKRSSVVSKAKELGYTPRSSTASTAKVVVSMINDQISPPSTITLDAYTPFTTIVDGTSYTFYNTAAQTASISGNQYTFPDVTLTEGSPLQFSYTYDGSTPFIIPNTKVDRSTIHVSVQENATSSTSTSYTEASSILSLTSTSTAYFLRELEDTTLQLEFGNDLIGKALSPGNVVTVSYFSCNEELPNGASSFNYSGTAPTNTSVYVTVTTSAAGGSGPEDIESIRYNAPFAFTTQNRCVTVDDYKSIIMSLYTPAKSVMVWGGEDNIPPQYGRVYISVVPDSEPVRFLTESEKTYILNDIVNPRKSLTVTPIMVDPVYVKLQIDTTFYYNPQLTTRSSADLVTEVTQTITDFNNSSLGQFGSVFKYSKLVGEIDSTEQSIVSNITTVKIHFEIEPVYDTNYQYIIDLGNPIYNSGVPEESIKSTGFITPLRSETCYIDDVPTAGSVSGILRMYYLSVSGEKVFVQNIGTVNYVSGIISVDGIEITNIESDPFKFIIKPQSNDVVGYRNQYVVIEPTLLTVNSVVDLPTRSYTFTSSRN